MVLTVKLFQLETKDMPQTLCGPCDNLREQILQVSYNMFHHLGASDGTLLVLHQQKLHQLGHRLIHTAADPAPGQGFGCQGPTSFRG